MNILVVGSTSTIGRALQNKLSLLGAVQTAGRREADILIDLSEWRTVPETVHDYDVVIHVAADFGGHQDGDFVRAEIVNIVGTLTACRLARNAKASHFVLISTIFAACSEDSPYFGIYALSKRHAEEAARLFCRNYGITFTVLRPAQVYDMAGECRRHQPLLYSMADRAENGEDIILHGRHDAMRNYICLDDLAEIVMRTVEAKVEGTFNCAYPRSVSLSEVAHAAFAAFGKGGEVQFDSKRPDLADILVADNTALYEKIYFTPEVDIVEGMHRIRSYREKMRE